MDPLSDVLTWAPPRESTFSRSVLDPPWGLHFRDVESLTLEVVLQGHAWLLPGQGDPVHLLAGDVALTRQVGSYVLADSPRTRPGAVVYGPGRVAAAGEPESAAGDRWRLGSGRTYGDPTASHTVLLRSGYDLSGGIAARVLDALPRVSRVPAGSLPASALELMNSEMDVDRAGQHAILHRLLDLLVVYVIRAWFDTAAAAPAWYSAMRDPAVGRALRHIHDAPQRKWTVAGLAAEAGMSRAAFARRFLQLTGEPPMGYVTRLRMDIAADVLVETESTLDAVARRIGYSDGFSFSTAFKKYRGASPAEFRRRITEGRG